MYALWTYFLTNLQTMTQMVGVETQFSKCIHSLRMCTSLTTMFVYWKYTSTAGKLTKSRHNTAYTLFFLPLQIQYTDIYSFVTFFHKLVKTNASQWAASSGKQQANAIIQSNQRFYPGQKALAVKSLYLRNNTISCCPPTSKQILQQFNQFCIQNKCTFSGFRSVKPPPRVRLPVVRANA
jgi:hypothetical protein